MAEFEYDDSIGAIIGRSRRWKAWNDKREHSRSNRPRDRSIVPAFDRARMVDEWEKLNLRYRAAFFVIASAVKKENISEDFEEADRLISLAAEKLGYKI